MNEDDELKDGNFSIGSGQECRIVFEDPVDGLLKPGPGAEKAQSSISVLD